MLLLSEHLMDAGLVAFVDLARRNVADPRRFAQTSVGWVLRELSRSRPDDVRAFVADHGEAMSAEARRAASARL